MMSVSKKDLGDDDLGEIRSLGSPILSKIQQAFLYIRSIATGSGSEEFTSLRAIEGAHNSTLNIAWDKAEARLILVVKVIDFDMVSQIKTGHLTTPSWLENLAGGAQVEVNCLSVVDSLVNCEDRPSGLKAIIDDMTGHVAPRRIVCVGFCVGGSVATLSATWAAIQWPTADVRCISFGASAVGNAAFATAFKWLVGISYRVMFRRDPIPAQSTALAPHVLKHVHGGIYICGDAVRPGNQPRDSLAKADMGDHSTQAYMAALSSNCKRQCDREKAAAGVCRAKLGAQCILRCPIEKRKRRKAIAAANAAAVAAAARAVSRPADAVLTSQVSMRESVSSTSDSLDDDMDISQEPTGLASFMRAGMGNIVTDTATVSKAAVTSTFLALRKLGRSSHSSSSSSSSDGDSPLSDRTSASADSDSNLNRAASGTAKYDKDSAAATELSSHAELAEQAPHSQQTTQKEPVSALIDTRPEPGKAVVDGKFTQQMLSCGEVARDMIHAVMVEKGLTTADSPLWQMSLPELMNMTPDARTSNQTSRAQSSSLLPESSTAQSDQSNAEPSTAGSAGRPQNSLNGEDRTAGSASTSQDNSNGEGSTAGSAGVVRSAFGGEPGEQWAGSQSPDQVAYAGLAAAAENEADANPMQRVEEGSLGSAGLDQISTEPDEAAEQQEARKLTRQFTFEERDSSGVDQKDLSNLQKVLVVGKISQAAILAAAAYRNHEVFKRHTGITKSRLIYDKEHHHTKVHVGWLEGGTAVFAFRGTASKQDGLQDVKIFSRNIDYLQELYPGVKAHLGFMQQFAAVCHPERAETNMAAVLKELSGGQTPNRVICCGHSLGGALATLGAAWAALEYPDADIRCITFGSPRVANKVFGRAFSALVGTSLRLVHGFDPVPALPPSLMYKHVPGVIHIKRDDLLLKHRPWHTMLRSTVSDHGMLKYSKGVFRHMPGGLESLPSFFAPKPVKKMCENVCRLTGHGKVSSQPQSDGAAVSPDPSVSLKLGKRKGADEADHVWAGSFLACWGSGTLDHSDLTAAAAMKKGIVESRQQFEQASSHGLMSFHGVQERKRGSKKERREVSAVRGHDGSLCTPEAARDFEVHSCTMHASRFMLRHLDKF